MFKPDSITIKDIQSNPINGTTYVSENEAYTKTYEEYSPNTEIVTKIANWLTTHEEKLTFHAFGASWCGDCRIQIPRLVKIAETLGEEKMEVGIHSNIKVKAPYDRKKGELIWKSPPSPPETIDIRFDMQHIPAIFIFRKDGTCLGKIDEKPEHTPSLEGDILHYLA